MCKGLFCVMKFKPINCYYLYVFVIILFLCDLSFAKGDPTIRRGFDPEHPDKVPDLSRFEEKTPIRKFYIEKNYYLYRHPNPDWVPPKNRNYYDGYGLQKEMLQYGQDWGYQTNRYRGNTKADETTEYGNYRSTEEITYQNPYKPKEDEEKQEEDKLP